MTGHRFDPAILREYDIRGTVGTNLSEADAHAVGRAFGTVVQRGAGAPVRVVVAYDGRLSSPGLETALVEGLVRSGANVVRVGCGPTPLMYFAVLHLGADGGIMVTGSHNPRDDNGFKFRSGPHPFFGEEITGLGALAADGAFAQGSGTIEDEDVTGAYLDALAAGFEDEGGGAQLVLGWDAGNGATGAVLPQLVRRLPGRHVLLNEEVDGTFPAHHPDPSVAENLVQLQDTVVRERCDAGIALDGDGDRIGVVDDKGRVVWADQLLAILARDVLAAHPGATVIADVKCSRVLFDEVRRLGGNPLMWRTGNAPIKRKLDKTGAPLAGELAGHIFFRSHYGLDDALYAALRLASMLSRGRPLSALVDELPAAVNTPEIRFFCPEDRKFAVIDELRDRMRAAGADVIELDGVRVGTPDGWWLVRASNTQAALVARAEAADADALKRLRATMADQLALCGIELPD